MYLPTLCVHVPYSQIRLMVQFGPVKVSNGIMQTLTYQEMGSSGLMQAIRFVPTKGSLPPTCFSAYSTGRGGGGSEEVTTASQSTFYDADTLNRS